MLRNGLAARQNIANEKEIGKVDEDQNSWLCDKAAKMRTIMAKRNNMKINIALCSILAAGFLAGCAEESEFQLQAEAKITRADAQAIALTKVPNGTCKEGELEREHGKLIWSFGFTTPDTKDVTEVNVDAITGAIVNVEHEKAAKEAKEEKEEDGK
jgi:uncharacterized membrane protein YkoI